MNKNNEPNGAMELYGDYDEYESNSLINPDVMKEFLEQRRNSYLNCSLIFHPSYWKVYLALKEESPELAIKYLESLIAYGIDFVEPDPDDRLICALLDGPMKTIDKSIRKYFDKMSRVRREIKRLEDEAAQTVEKQEQAKKRLEEEAIERVEAQELLRQDSTDGVRA